jgi:hypothetical protein
MTMQKTLAAAAVASTVLPGAAAFAQQNELISIFNVGRNDVLFFGNSYRRALGASLDDGLIFRADLNITNFDFDATQASDKTLRLLVGYAFAAGAGSKFTGYGGLSYRDREFEPLSTGLENVDEVGFFVSGEFDHKAANGANYAALVEYDSTLETFYVSGYGVFDIGNAKLGPTVNYLQEDDYSRTAIGLRLQVPFNATSDVVATAAIAEGGVDGADDVDSSYFEIQLRTRF